MRITTTKHLGYIMFQYKNKTYMDVYPIFIREPMRME